MSSTHHVALYNGDIIGIASSESEAIEMSGSKGTPHNVDFYDAKDGPGVQALDSGDLDQCDWIYNDGELVNVLEQTGPSMKATIHKDFKSEPPELCLLCKIENDLEHFRAAFTPESIVKYIESYLKARFKWKSCYGYMFVDKGTFEKKLDFVDPENGQSWSVGNTTRSLVLYGFSRKTNSRKINPLTIGQEFMHTLNEHLKVHISA